jgi:hypothetical protein
MRRKEHTEDRPERLTKKGSHRWIQLQHLKKEKIIMTKEEFLRLPDTEKLKAMKKDKDYLSHDFQHQEIVEIASIDRKQNIPRITVWVRGVDGENWPRFTDYCHHKDRYDLIHGRFVFVEED